MKIERITPFLVDRCLLVRVYTDEGVVGTGEAGLWAYHKLVYEAIGELSAYFIGKDPARIEHHFQVVSRDTHFAGSVLSAALSAIDVALWDIQGKALGRPVHQLLGGRCRDKVNTFANVTGNTIELRAESARLQVERGYTSVRTLPFLPNWEQGTSTKVISTAVAIMRAIREAVGDEIDVGLDIHRNLTPGDVITLARELEPLRMLYLEDPIAPESIDALRYVAQHIDIPLAMGERNFSTYQFKELVATGTCSLIRPDLSLAGGITQVKKIASLAEASFVGIFPHLMGSPVNLAAFVQISAAIPNYFLMECNESSDFLNEVLDQPLQREGGYVIVPDRPGIGVDLREDKLARFPYRPNSIRGNYAADGSVAH